jgi:glycosyltransferase involved in cell wall biosynthesis
LHGALPRDEVTGLFGEIAAAQLVVVPAPHLVGGLQRLGVAHARIILNAIDLDCFTPEPAEPFLQRSLGIEADDIVVAHVSNLKAIKRPHDFVEGAAIALAAEPRLRFLIVGDGPLMSSLRSAVAAVGLLSRFVFTGWVRYEQMPRYMRLADVVVMPSAGEGLARVYLETMACGRVLIASNVAAARDVITDGIDGLLFPVGDVEALSVQVVRVARSNALRRRIGAAAHLRAQRHGLDLAADAYIEAFRAHLEPSA